MIQMFVIGAWKLSEFRRSNPSSPAEDVYGHLSLLSSIAPLSQDQKEAANSGSLSVTCTTFTETYVGH